MSTYEEDRKSTSKSPIDDSFRDIKLLNYSRPLTAKRLEKDSQKTQKKLFPRANPTPKPKRSSTKERPAPILSKLKPGHMNIDKEVLYNENITLKLKINELKSIIIKYRAKLVHLEKEINKKEELNTLKNPNIGSSLVKLLKQTIKDLRQELELKQIEIDRQKKNMKLSRFLEQELETKAYVDECTRLRHLLEEVLSDTSEEGKNESSELKTQNLLKIIEDNNKEILKLKEKLKSDGVGKTSKTPKFQEEFSKLVKELESVKKALISKEKKFMEEIESLKANLRGLEKENSGYKIKIEESKTLIQNLYKELKSLRQKKKSKLVPPKLLQAINRLLETENKPVENFLSSLSHSKAEFIYSKDLLFQLSAFDSSVTQTDIDSVIAFIKHESVSKISIAKLTDYYESFDFSLFNKKNKTFKVLELFEHINLRMQLHRIHKENLMEALLGTGMPSMKEITDQDIIYLFTSSPFDFTRKQAICLTEYLFEGKKSIESSKFMEKFYNSIKDWKVFTTSDEEHFDRLLLSLVFEHKAGIEEYCSLLDKENKGCIASEEFFRYMDQNNITLIGRLKDYLIVLFYSNNLELNSVPFKQFLQAYSAQDDGGDDPKTSIVQKYLEKIAAQLITLNKSVRETFTFDRNGLILTEDFTEGLSLLDLEEIPPEHLTIIMEGLQYELEKRVVCIFVDELEDILETFGVPNSNKFDTSEIFSEQKMFGEDFEGHVQKISLLDSVQLDLLASSDS